MAVLQRDVGRIGDAMAGWCSWRAKMRREGSQERLDM